MRLGIFGDSFATATTKVDTVGSPWPLTLAEKINMVGEYFASPGTSIWWSYQNFLKTVDKFDVVVFTYSQHNRWHHLSEEAEGMHYLTVRNDYTSVPEPTKERNNIANILYSAHRYLQSEELDLFIFQNVFNHVNALCKEKNIKLINVLPFESGEMLIDYSNRVGSVIYNLNKVSVIEQSQLTPDQAEKFWKMISTDDKRPCHMSWYHNDLLATIITENISNEDNKLIDIMQDARISSDPKYNKHFYEN
jgi:hypothetical protein